MSRASSMSSNAGTAANTGTSAPVRMQTPVDAKQELTSEGLQTFAHDFSNNIFEARQKLNEVVNGLSPAILGDNRRSFHDAKNELLTVLDRLEQESIPRGRAFADRNSKTEKGEPANGINITVVDPKTFDSGQGNINLIVDGSTGGQVTKKFGQLLRKASAAIRAAGKRNNV